MRAHHFVVFGLVFSCFNGMIFLPQKEDLSSFTLLCLGFGFLVEMAVGLLGLRIYTFMTLDRYQSSEEGF